MKKRIYIGIMIACMALLTGCGAKEQTAFREDDRLSIVTTIYPMYDFTSQIAGDRAEIVNLVPAGTEPHDFELSTNDMRLLEQADVLIYNGAGMEHFIDKTLDSLSNPDLMVVETAKDLELLETEHSHDAQEEHDGEHASEKTDPHTWLSVKNAIRQAEAIKDALCEVDPEYRDVYTERFETYKKKLEDLDQRYETELAACPEHTIVVAHEAFGYMCRDYGLVQEAVEGLTADSEPDAARMKEIIDFCKEKNIHVIFFEELVSPKVANTIADEVGAKTMVLNPVEGLTAEQEKQGLSYISIMEQNLEALKEALRGN